MLIVAGLSIKNLRPRVWDPKSPFNLPNLKAVMVSYGEFHQLPARRQAAMDFGLHPWLGVPDGVKVYLDNGAFYFATSDEESAAREYEKFVKKAKPDWKPIPRDWIPFPEMSHQKRRSCFDRTMKANVEYRRDGFVPVVHIGKHILDYTAGIQADLKLSKKPCIALGGLVPNLLRKPKAMPYGEVLAGLRHARSAFKDKLMHVFGVGGVSTLHLAALLGLDSADSSGWRNRAARGIVMLPGSGERTVASLGKWKTRQPSEADWRTLKRCGCPACSTFGVDGLTASKLHGFECRATHNLWVLLEENAWLEREFAAGTYAANYVGRVENSVYRPLIDEVVAPR
jgi:7-cyano-7-deazaguanine tRNA-ribosyltransferase